MRADRVIRVDVHPLLDLRGWVTTLPRPLGEIAVPDQAELRRAQQPGFDAPVQRDEATKAAVRDLLRHGGFKPSGRSKPASEYLVRAAADGGLRAINAVVDAVNAASLHSGLPLSVIDLDRARAPFAVRIAAPGSEYVFNPAGQVIDVSRLLCLYDADGPTANAVKDAQRTKTHPGTYRVLTVVWGTRALEGRAGRVRAWTIAMLDELGAESELVETFEATEPAAAD
jgi:DNA/RNA-binding domain of Phe-tRNA-synthetase-like protein